MKNLNVKYQRGMTLIELMISVTVLAILVTVAVPSMNGLFERKNVTDVGKVFERSLSLAKSEASERGVIVRIRPTSGSGDWSQGWYLERTIAATDTTPAYVQLIRQFPALTGNPTFISTTFNDATQLEIFPDRQTRTPGTFVLSYPTNCSAGQITYTLLINGHLQKRVTGC